MPGAVRISIQEKKRQELLEDTRGIISNPTVTLKALRSYLGCVNFLAGRECKMLDRDGKCIFRHEGLVKGSDPDAITKRHAKAGLA